MQDFFTQFSSYFPASALRRRICIPQKAIHSAPTANETHLTDFLLVGSIWREKDTKAWEGGGSFQVNSCEKNGMLLHDYYI
jgi:hypothetical protein